MRHPTLVLGLALTAALTGCTGTDGGTAPPPSTAGDLKLVAYDSCGEALKELKTKARPHVGPYGFESVFSATAFGGAPQAADGRETRAAAPEHSTTNVHEAGVDEPDLVKTDGRRIVSVADGVLRVIDVAGRKQTGTLRLGEQGSYHGAQLLLAGDRALVVLPGHGAEPLPVDRMASPVYPVSATQLLLVDLAEEPEVLSRMTLEGAYVDARMVDSTVRLVTRSMPTIPFKHPDRGMSPEDAKRRNYVVLARSTVDDWLPGYEIDDGRTVTRGRVGCERVSHPERYTGTSMLTVFALDLAAGALSGDRSVSIVADGSTVYGVADSLYVASQHAPGGTEVYKFDVSGAGAPRHVASGAVHGWLINQYAMSEHDGFLRIATTTGSRGGTQSSVYVLAHQGGRLVPVGQVDGLGKTEQIYAVRFLGPVGYVVTFRQVDPLYVIDLRDPEQPKVTGELKITGYSAYLHPASEGRLIGVGQEASPQGQRLGLQVSLFDVSDPAAPGRLAQHHIRYAHSAAEFDPHAFLYWPRTGLLVIPVADYRMEPVDGEKPVAPHGGALVLRVSGDRLVELGTVSHPTTDYRGLVQRSLVIDGALWTVSQAGVQANDGQTLKSEAWIPFR